MLACFLSCAMHLRKKHGFSFINTILAHGWLGLAPFEYDEESKTLVYAFEIEGQVVGISLTETASSIKIKALGDSQVSRERLIGSVRHILRIDEKFEEMHGMVSEYSGYRWIGERSFGPMLRSATVYEDLVKTICTTNCSWGLTKSMVRNLVRSLGKKCDSGQRAFPGARSMAREDDGFYAREIKAGYRGPYLRELAESVATGAIEPESWLDSDLPTAELKKEIKKIKGVGDYAAEHILKLIGRYDGLALDSFLRSCFYQSYNDGKPCPDKRIEKHYHRFGDWKGLIIWFDMVEKRRQMSLVSAA